ncbi:MAG TPA: CBS domain-containing protein [Rubricoccaceae bacterium]|jgi:CBS domain-containing protein|nr:CBS domain-containing protein [Rubricoccaceae bacterium]
MLVREIMTASPATCTPDTPLRDVARMMVECDCGAIPVVARNDGEQPEGIVTDRDIVVRLVAEGRNPLDATAGDAMTTSVVTVRADDDVETAAEQMKAHQLRRLVVVDGGGRITGVVAQADLALETSDALAGDVVENVSRPGR